MFINNNPNLNMMMNVTTRSIILLLFSLYTGKTFSQEIPKLRIDLDKAFGGASSEYLDSLEFIPLETTKASLFGQVSKLIVTDSSFVITDQDTQSILFFSRVGKFLHKVSKSAGLNATGAIFDRQQHQVEVAFENTEHTKLIIDCYSLEGNFLKKGSIANNSLELAMNSIAIDKSHYWLRNNIPSYDSLSNFGFFTQYEKGQRGNSIIPFDSSNRYGLYRITKEVGYIRLPVLHDKAFYFSTPIEHKIYRINAITGAVEPLFQVVFTAKFAINNNLLNATNRKQVDSIVNKKWYSEKTVLSLENIYYDKNQLFFKIKTGYFGYFATDGSITARNFLYKFQNNQLVALEKIFPDATSYFLPFCDPMIISYEGFYNYKKLQYTHISSLRMFAAYKATKQKNPQYPAALQTYFKTQSRQSNPVIVQMKLKN